MKKELLEEGEDPRRNRGLLTMAKRGLPRSPVDRKLEDMLRDARSGSSAGGAGPTDQSLGERQSRLGRFYRRTL